MTEGTKGARESDARTAFYPCQGFGRRMLELDITKTPRLLGYGHAQVSWLSLPASERRFLRVLRRRSRLDRGMPRTAPSWLLGNRETVPINVSKVPDDARGRMAGPRIAVQ